jgi:hypothetical protein
LRADGCRILGHAAPGFAKKQDMTADRRSHILPGDMDGGAGGVVYFALVGRHKLILSPEEEFAMARGEAAYTAA